jgi:hypothetical protein
MAVTYAVNATALNRLEVSLGANAVTPASGTSVDAAGNFGQLVIGTTGMATVLATFTLQNPSFSFATRTATLLGTPLTATASASGTAAVGQLRDKNGTVIVPALTVGTSGTDIIINSTTITSGETCTCTAGTITG